MTYDASRPPAMRGTVTWVLALFVFVEASMVGCARGHASCLFFAPDHKRFAYLWIDVVDLPVVDSPLLAQSAKLFLASVDSPNDKRSVPIALAMLTHTGSALESYIRLAFSPDSRQIAILREGQLLVVSWEGRLSRLSAWEDGVSSFGWYGDDEIGYVVYTGLKESDDSSFADRTFWLQRLGAPMPPRVKVRREERVEVVSPVDRVWNEREYWSSSGRYVIYMDRFPRPGQFCCLDIAKQEMFSFGYGQVSRNGVAWALDDSRALCVSFESEPDGKTQALLLDRVTRKVKDVSEPFAKVFPGYPPLLEPRTTADGQFFIANTLERGGYLVKIEPWQVVPVGQMLFKKVKSGEERPLWVKTTPAPTWLVTYGRPGHQWLLNFDVSKVVPLGDSNRGVGPAQDFVGAWGFDGKNVVTVDYSNRVAVKPVDLPQASGTAQSGE